MNIHVAMGNRINHPTVAERTLVKDVISLEDYRIQDDIALVIGNEGNGINNTFSQLKECEDSFRRNRK